MRPRRDATRPTAPEETGSPDPFRDSVEEDPPVAYASPYPSVEIPDLPVADFVLAAGKDRPDAAALVDGLTGETITHGELAAYVDRFAAALHESGLGKGDVVAVFSPNTI